MVWLGHRSLQLLKQGVVHILGCVEEEHNTPWLAVLALF